MVARLQLGLLLLLLPPLLQAEIRLQLPAQLEQGRMVQAELLASGPGADLLHLSLVPLQQIFYIAERGEVERVLRSGQPIQRRRLKLLPLHSGPFSLPQWQLSDHQILPASDPATGEPIEIRFTAPVTEPWQRQQLAYQIEVLTPQRFIRLQLAEAHDADWIMRLSPANSELLQQEPRRFRHRYRLWLFPLQAGEQSLQLPLLSYLHDGVATHRFYPPPLTLSVKPLPAYLPDSTQVGRVSVQRLSPRFGLLRSGERGELRLKIRADGVPSALWSLPLPELQRSAAIEPLPVRARQQEVVAFDGVTSSYTLSLPFESANSQLWDTQSLPLEYFDPQQGKRVTRPLSLPTPWVITAWQGWGVLLLVVVMGIWLARKVMEWWQGQHRMARAYLQAWHLVEAAEEAADLRRAQSCIAAAEGWGADPGIDNWLGHWQLLQPQQELSDWQQGMQALCYRGETTRLETLSRQMQAMLRQRLGWRLRWYRLLTRLAAV